MTTTAAHVEALTLTATTAAARFLSRVVGWAVGVLDIALPTAWRPAPRTAPAPDAEHAAFVAESAASLAAFVAELAVIRRRVPLHVVDAPARVSLPCVTVRPAPAPKRTRRTARSRNANPVMASAARTTTAPAKVTVAELRRQATARGHKGVSRLAKAALITLLAVADPAPAPAAAPAPAPVATAPADAEPAVKPLSFAPLLKLARKADTKGRYAARPGSRHPDHARFLSTMTDAERVKAAAALGITPRPGSQPSPRSFKTP